MTGTTLPGPGVDFEVCLGVGAAENAAVWDTAVFDFSTWQQADTSLGDWVDFTCSTLEPVAFGAGSSPDGVVSRWEAQTCQLVLYGETFDPRSGPYAGLLGPALPIRCRWKPSGTDDTAWLDAFVGQCDDDGFTYDPKTQLASMAATDGTRVFSAFDGLEQNAVGGGETAAERVTRIADLVAWPAARRDITPGGVTVQATTLAQSAWTLLLQVADTDLAVLWVDRAGRLAYRPQGKVNPSRQVAAIIGCDVEAPPGGVAIAPVNMVGQQPNVTRNIVSISRQAASDTDTPVTVTVRDEPSVARYLSHSYQRTDLIHTDDNWSTTVADAILESAAWPTTAPASVDLSSRADPASSVLLLALDPAMSIQVTDGLTLWWCEPAGWQVTVARAEISGHIDLIDVSVWAGGPGGWDGDTWDTDQWGF